MTHAEDSSKNNRELEEKDNAVAREEQGEEDLEQETVDEDATEHAL